MGCQAGYYLSSAVLLHVIIKIMIKTINGIDKYIVRLPQVNNGEPTIKGTRMPVSFVMDQIEIGWSLDQIAEGYDLTLSIVKKISLLMPQHALQTQSKEKTGKTARISNNGQQSASSL